MSDRLSLVPRQARPYQGERAGLVTRVIASTVDAAVVTAALIAAYLGLTAVWFVIDPRDFEVVRAPQSVVGLTWSISCVIYLTVAWASTGRSYGNRLMGLRVVRTRHRLVPLLLALLRALLCVGFPIGLLWSMPSASRRSLQDVVLGTCVIYDWSSRPGPAQEP